MTFAALGLAAGYLVLGVLLLSLNLTSLWRWWIKAGAVVITTGFIGYLVAGLPGAVLAAGATFLPCYLITVLAAPHFKKYGKRPALLAFVDGITAAAVGAIAGSVVVLGMRSITDLPTAALAIGTAAVLWKFKKIPEPVIVAVAALIGLAIY